MDTTNYEINVTHEEAKEIVIKNATLFYSGKQTEINDLVYDKLLELIKKDEPDFDIYKNLNFKVDGIQVEHKTIFRDFYKEADIDQINTEEKFNEWKSKYYILPKFDGSSTVSYFNEDGSIDMILSRSDDVTGFVNTEKLRTKLAEAMTYRLKVPHEGKIKTILSEAIVSKENGNRSQANGLINSKYRQEEVDKLLTLMPFDVEFYDGTRAPNIFFEITDYSVFSHLRDEGEIINELGTIPCDGIVMYDRNLDDTLLVIKKLYYTEKKLTKITGIDWDVSWTSGIFHPVAEFDTVELDNTFVSRASLYNYQNVIDSKIGVGAEVEVIKANMTIPQILTIKKTVEPELAPKCPYCGHELVPYNLDLVCSNKDCGTWRYMIQKRLIDMYISEPTPYFEYLEEHYSELHLGMVKEFKEGWYEDVLTPKSFLYIAGIPRVGEAKINKIADSLSDKTYTNFKDLMEAMWDYTSDLQYSYLEVITPKIEFIINKLREFENG